MFCSSDISDLQLFQYRFLRIGVTDTWLVYSNNSEQTSALSFIGVLDEAEMKMLSVEEGIHIGDNEFETIWSEFQRFSFERPEYLVGKRLSSKLFDVSVINSEIMQNIYNKLIYGVCILTMNSDEIAKKYAERCVQWLSKTDFYIAPASTRYHDSEPYGLLRHTLKVVDKMTELLSLSTFENVNIERAILTALTHDWCKIDFYEQYMRNVKDESTGTWSQVSSYRYKGAKLPFGHGITSMYIAQNFFKLTAEQALAIRWHMGEYDVTESEKHDLMDANARYPMVMLLQFADRLSIL